MIVTSAQMKAMEEAVFAQGVSAEELMDQVGKKIADIIESSFSHPGTLLLYLGKGHNGGDGLVAVRILAEWGWKISLRLVTEESELAPLTKKKLEAVRGYVGFQEELPVLDREEYPLVILDGLLGLGARGSLKPPYLQAIQEMNTLRAEKGATIFAIDIPSGLHGDTGESMGDTVRADCTLTIAHVKQGLLADGATDYVGRLFVVPLPEIEMEAKEEKDCVITPQTFAERLPCRTFTASKYQSGRVGIVAGSRGLLGAAVLAAHGALRSGAGYVLLYVEEPLYAHTLSMVRPEVMVNPLVDRENLMPLSEEKVDVWAIGPGLGSAFPENIASFIQEETRPMVVDADALSALAKRGVSLLKECRGPRLLTPHQKEMARLLGGEEEETRKKTAEKFVEEYPVTLLFKGARSLIAQRELPLAYNSTGNSGMAVGGFGDVLTGMCAALIAQGVSLYDAACLGSWVLGRAAEIGVSTREQSSESLLPSDVVEALGAAFSEMRMRSY